MLLTRETDIRLGEKQGEDLKNRVDFAKEHNGDDFVSIHANASKNHDDMEQRLFIIKGLKRKN